MYLGLKLLCVFSIGCIGSAQMFLPIFCKKELGFGTDKIGFIYSITPFVSFVALPYWTAMIDRTGQYRRIMFRNMFIALLCITSISIVPSLSHVEWIRMILVSLSCFGYAFFGYPIIVAIVDSLIFKILAEKKELFGRQKVGLPIGFASSVFLTGFLSQKLDTNYALFFVFGVSNIAFLITLLCIHIPASSTTTEDGYGSVASSPTPTITPAEDGIEEEEKGSIWDLLKDPYSIQFFTFMSFTGFCIAVVQAFLYLYIENDLKGTPFMVGLFGPLGSSTELICFYFSHQILSKLGARGMLITSQLIIVYRCVTYMICTEIEYGAYLATITQLLHGVGFSLMWSAGALQADELAPTHLKSTAQGLLNMAYNGIGSGIGALVAGYIYEKWGSRAMWLTVAITCLFSIVLYTSTRIRKVVFVPLSNLIRKA